MQTVVIDGAQGEGGGQIVRSSVALSLVTGRPVRIENIRAGRDKPGLMRQHLAAVQAAAEISGGKLTGAEIGSRSLEFLPGDVTAGSYHFKIATAGSATLLLQTILPALLTAQGRSELTFEGGTHNPWAPPFDFLERAFLPLVNRMGPRVTARLFTHGFYPAGGGRFTVTIEPSEALGGFDLLERGTILQHSARAIVANLPEHIANREINTILKKMGWDATCGLAQTVPGHGAGNVVLIEVESEHITEVFTSFGRTGVKAEQVADEAVKQARSYLAAGVPVGPYLADQLLLPLAISAATQHDNVAQRGGVFLTLPLSRHSLTQLAILKAFLDVEITVTPTNVGTQVSLSPPKP
jgi:RNA 3'-terminal phosphate cyclase (ATP)